MVRKADVMTEEKVTPEDVVEEVTMGEVEESTSPDEGPEGEPELSDVIDEPEPYTNEVEIGGELITIGPLNAMKTALAIQLFANLAMKGKKLAMEEQTPDSFMMQVLASVDEGELVRLGMMLSGLDEKRVKKDFDLNWILSAFAIQLENVDFVAALKNWSRLSAIFQI